LLIYGTAGAAFADTRLQFCQNGGCLSDSQTRNGWVAGGGVEYGLLDNLSVKAEYLHADFGDHNYFDPRVFSTQTGTIINTRKTSLTDDIVRVGLNYRFGWGGPVVAKY
jgi:outer membrane immunogenic protein